MDGMLTVYKDLNKYYLKECCLEAYLAGSNNKYITQDQLRFIYKTYKSAISKLLIIEGICYKVYQLKKNKFKAFSKLQFARNITLVQYQNSYRIMTNTQYTKLCEREDRSNIAKAKALETNKCNSAITLTQERASINLNEPVYKIGITTKPNSKRFTINSKKYKIQLFKNVNNCNLIEDQVMHKFKSKYKIRRDYGNKYFEGDYNAMIQDINNIIIDNAPKDDIADLDYII
jgi:hypothetical protein